MRRAILSEPPSRGTASDLPVPCFGETPGRPKTSDGCAPGAPRDATTAPRARNGLE